MNDQLSESVRDALAKARSCLEPDALVWDGHVAMADLIEAFLVYLENKADGETKAPGG